MKSVSILFFVSMLISAVSQDLLGQTTIAYFPTGTQYLNGIVAGPDGALWFEASTTPQFIGRMTLGGAVELFPIPYVGSFLAGPLTPGPDGSIWFADWGTNSIGRICTGLYGRCSVTGEVTEFPIPTAACHPLGIVTGPNGNLFFTEFDANQIGQITTAGLVIGEYTIPTANSEPRDITAGPETPGTNGSLWFAEESGNNIGEVLLDGRGNVVLPLVEFPAPTPGSAPFSITTSAARNPNVLWFTEYVAGRLGKLVLTNGRVTSISDETAPVPNPTYITPGADGNLWFVNDGDQLIGSINQAGNNPQVYALNYIGAYIASGPDGALWISTGFGDIVHAIPSARRNGVDMSAYTFGNPYKKPTQSLYNNFRAAGVQYIAYEADQNGDTVPGQALNDFSFEGFGIATYCFLYFDGSHGSGGQQASACVGSLGSALDLVSFVALDVETTGATTCSLSACVAIIQGAISTLESHGILQSNILIYTNSGAWQALTGNLYNSEFVGYKLWTAALGSFIGYTDTAGNFLCSPNSTRVQSLNPTPRGGTGVPNLQIFSKFGPWTTQSGTQFDIGGKLNLGVSAACLFGTEVDYDTFDSALFGK
jgi:virginiamycin B lyase